MEKKEVKPRGYWTYELCKEEAQKYNTKKDFTMNNKSAYASAYKNNWLDDICAHMTIGHWTYEKCKNLADLYKVKSEFIKNESNCYKVIIRRKWHVLIEHMVNTQSIPYVNWSYDNCKEEALKYDSRNKFSINCRSAYYTALKNNWLDDICKHMKIGNLIWDYETCKSITILYNDRSEFIKTEPNCYNAILCKKWRVLMEHMTVLRIPNTHWTYDICKEEALKYNTRTEFLSGCSGAYNKSLECMWLDSICEHMVCNQYPRNYWNYDNCKQIALEFNNITDLENTYNGAYKSIIRNKWRDELCSHMSITNKWTYENCKEEALKYNCRSIFRIESGSAYKAVRRNDWWELCNHMVKLGSLYERMIYAYEFEDNHVYIGLTYNIEKRNKQHLSEKTSQVYKHMKKTNTIPKLIKISDYIDVYAACELEESTLNNYKNNNWIILNKNKTGSIGGLIYDRDNKKVK